MTARPAWTTACPDWEKRIVAGESLVPVGALFPESADLAMRVFNDLVMVDAGNQRMGDISLPWLTSFVEAIFGAYDPDSGRRLIQEFLMLIAKKNGKSSDAAGIMLVALILNWRPSAEYFILAPTKEVADNSFFPARDAVRADPELSKVLHVQDNIRQIKHRQTGATLKVIAADSETVAGKKGVGVLVDELWLFGQRPNAKAMLREALGGLLSRPEGFVIYLTTQSDDPPAGVFKEKLDYARDVRDGVIVDPKFLPVLYEFPPAMIASKEYRKPENFYVTNPNLGASVDNETLLDMFRKAEHEGEKSLIGFFAKHLNVQVGMAERYDRWIGADFWIKKIDERLREVQHLIERSEVITVGADGGGLDDMLGFSITGREEGTRKWLQWNHAWLHPIAFDRRKSEVSHYLDFEKEGSLTIVERAGDDIAQLVEFVMLCEKAGLLDKIGVDPVGIGSIVDALMQEGIELNRIEGVPQGYKMNGAIKTVERKLAGGDLIHGDTALMRYCVANARTVMRGNAASISKEVSGVGKIDPLIATFCSASLMMMDPQRRKKTFAMFVM